MKLGQRRKRIVVSRLLAGLFLVVLMLSVTSAALAASSVATVKGTANGDNYALALQNAEYKAVFKALSHLIRQDNTSPEQVKPLLDSYEKYVLQQKVLQRKHQETQCFVIAKITIDTDRLQADLEQLIATRHQAQIFQMPACFLVRVLQAENPEEADGIVLTTCSSHYQNLGFETETNYHYALARKTDIARLAGESYEAYCSWAENKLLHEWQEYGFALLGEIALSIGQQDSQGTTRKAHVRVKAFDVNKERYIGSFEADYQFRAATVMEAERQVLNKAAMDFAEVLGGQTLAYWSGRK